MLTHTKLPPVFSQLRGQYEKQREQNQTLTAKLRAIADRSKQRGNLLH